MQTSHPIFVKLLANPDNYSCFECNSKNVQWASVTNGIFICMNCSGMHRGFGVELSFVRSITMDEWSDFQLSCMQLGGNARLRIFLKKYNIELSDSNKKDKYKTKACRFYRAMLKAESEGNYIDQPEFSTEEGSHIVEPKNLNLNSYGGFGSDGNAPEEDDNEQSLFSTEGFKSKFKEAGGFISKQTETLKQKVGETNIGAINVSEITGGVKTGFFGGWSKIKAATAFIGNKANDAYANSGMKDGVSNATDKIKEKSKESWDVVNKNNRIGDRFDKVKEFTKEKANYVGEKSKEVWKDTREFTSKYDNPFDVFSSKNNDNPYMDDNQPQTPNQDQQGGNDLFNNFDTVVDGPEVMKPEPADLLGENSPAKTSNQNEFLDDKYAGYFQPEEDNAPTYGMEQRQDYEVQEEIDILGDTREDSNNQQPEQKKVEESEDLV